MLYEFSTIIHCPMSSLHSLVNYTKQLSTRFSLPFHKIEVINNEIAKVQNIQTTEAEGANSLEKVKISFDHSVFLTIWFDKGIEPYM